MDILDQFEADWQRGQTPDWQRDIDAIRAEGGSVRLCELIHVDMERRWRASNPLIKRYSTRKYLEMLDHAIDDHQKESLLCWEYYVRNRWGDCPTRSQILEGWSSSLPGLPEALTKIAKTIPWPSLTLEVGKNLLAQMSLDAPIEIGRQTPGEPGPYSIVSLSGNHRLIISPLDDASISRRQLKIRLTTPCEIEISNTSQNRAVAFFNLKSLAPGQMIVRTLPVGVHIKDDIFLWIRLGISRQI